MMQRAERNQEDMNVFVQEDFKALTARTNLRHVRLFRVTMGESVLIVPTAISATAQTGLKDVNAR